MIRELHHTVLSIKKIHKILQSGIFVLPKLQRFFSWNGHQAANLVDSIYQSIAIGGVTLWDASRSKKDLFRTSSSVLPEYRSLNKNIWFLLDGQQRISILYRIFEGGVVTAGFRVNVDFSKIVFRVTEGGSVSGRIQYRKPDYKTWISVTDILSSEWRRRLAHLTVGQLNRAEVCRQRILDYKIVITSLKMDNMEDAREVFIRLNALSMSLTASDRAFARAVCFDLREMVSVSRKKFPIGFQPLNDEVFLQTRALLDGVQDVGVDAMSESVRIWNRRIDDDEKQLNVFKIEWDTQHAAMGRAIDFFVNELCVLDVSMLPYPNMISTLTTFFVRYSRRPNSFQVTEIKKWFFCTGIAQRYSGRGYRKNILNDVAFFSALGLGRNVSFVLDELVDPFDISRSIYSTRSSITIVFYCLLVLQKPIYLENGNSMQMSNIAGEANKRNRHHIFPQKFLQDAGVGRLSINSILNIGIFPSDENSGFGSRPPLNYLAAFKGKRHFKKALTRHLIPAGGNSAIWSTDARGFLTFINQRLCVVCNAFEDAAGVEIFKNNNIIYR